MKKEDFIGVWKLMEYGEGKILTSKTHLVVQEDILWEVYPNTTYYENKPGPEVRYTFESSEFFGQPAKLSLANGFKYLVKKSGDTLVMKLGPVFGSFPKDFNDSGNVGKYILEEEELSKTIGILPDKVAVEAFKIEGLATLKYDDNLNWWEGHTKFQGKKIRLNIAVDEAHKFEPLNKIKDKLKQLEVLSLDQIAAENLLSLFNESWNEEDIDISLDDFIKKITLESITLEIDGASSIWFEDGDLFGGHSINVSLDAANKIQGVQIMG